MQQRSSSTPDPPLRIRYLNFQAWSRMIEVQLAASGSIPHSVQTF